MKNSITIASVQMFVDEDREKNLKTIEECIASIKRLYPQVKMVVLPELSCSYIHLDIFQQAQEIPGAITTFFSNLSKKNKIWLIPGSIYEKSNDIIYNTTPVFDPNGDLIGKYRKRYPWHPYEKTKAGKTPFAFEVKGVGKIGVMICYDLWFPEVARDLIDVGAELIIIPTMTTTGDRYQERIITKATAITQQCYVISCNGVGYGGVGGSLIVDPEGCTVQDCGGGALIQTAIIDFNRVRLIRKKGIAGVTNPLRDFYRNRQVFDVYKKYLKE